MYNISKARVVREQGGVEIIEFAFVLPLLAILLIGGIEFGRAFYTYNVLTKSVRNAARYLSSKPIASSGTISAATVTKTKNLAVYGNIAGTGAPVIGGLSTAHINVPSPGTVVSVQQIYVTVSANYPYPSLFRYILPNSTFQPKETMIAVGPVTF
jgi:Flp pilus assembly protein TadG